MNFSIIARRLIGKGSACFALMVAAMAFSASAGAGEPAVKFLEELRNAGYYELALHYLDQMATSSLAPPDLKKVLLYERAQTYTMGSKVQRDYGIRDKWIDDAEASFAQFVKEQPDHPLVMKARDEMGYLMIERAQIKLAISRQPGHEGEKDALQKQAREYLGKGLAALKANQETMKKELEALGTPDERKRKEYDRIMDLRNAYIDNRLAQAHVEYEIAKTYKGDDAKYKPALEGAAKTYEKLSDDYPEKLISLFALMYSAKAYSDLGNYDKAIEFFEELRMQDANALRDLINEVNKDLQKAYRGKGDAQSLKAALDVGKQWLGEINSNEKNSPAWNEFKLEYAQSILAHSRQKGLDPKAKENEEQEAVKLLQEVIQYSREFRDTAQDLLTELGKTTTIKAAGPADLKNFEQGAEASNEALVAMQQAQRMVAALQSQIAAEKDAEKKAKLQAELQKNQKLVEEARDRTLATLLLTIRLADKDTPKDQLNDLRFYAAYLLYEKEDYYRAALLGDFVARHYPLSRGAKQSAQIVLASFAKLYGKMEEGSDRSFELEQMSRIAEYIVDQWPNEPEAQQALVQLVTFMVQLGDLQRAESYLQQIPEDSQARGEADLQTGQALWAAYLRGKKTLREAQPGAANLPDPAKLEEMKDRSATILEAGMQRMRTAGTADNLILRAGESLVQIYLGSDQPQKAIDILEDPNVGPKTILDKPGELEKIKGFDGNANKEIRQAYKERVYKAALRAYIGSLPTAPNAAASEAMISKAVGVMDSLKDLVGNTEEGRRQLTAIYVSLAKDLEEQMANATPEVRKKLSGGFETFLNRLGSTSKELNVLNWVAETFFSMAKGFDEGTGAANADAQKYYGKANETYSKILEMAKANQLTVTAQMQTQIRLRQATIYGRMGDSAKAIEIFEDVLKASPSMINVQVQAAQAFQDMAAVGDPKFYVNAISGGNNRRGDGKPIIWGWGRLAQMASQYPQYMDTYFQARLNLAKCHFEYAKRIAKDKRAERLQYAKLTIVGTHDSYPQLGGDKWRPQYDTLLKQIQTEMNEPAIGLEALPKPVAVPEEKPDEEEKPAAEGTPAAEEKPDEEKPPAG